MKMTKTIHPESDQNQLPRKKKFLLIVLIVVADINWGANTQLPAPFYPKLAEKRGASPSQVERKLNYIQNVLFEIRE